MMSNKTLGDFGEEVAADSLRAKGYRILARNWRTSAGEIDIIAEQNDVIVFVEVKTRTSDLYGTPQDAITQNKRRRIIRSSLVYLTEMDLLDRDWRVDMVAILCGRNWVVTNVEHYENVIEGSIEEFL
ncbi:MAG: YraN family protein [Anaerolineales bacterium]|nr:YraN family protein [Anaerolineales bacterium]